MRIALASVVGLAVILITAEFTGLTDRFIESFDNTTEYVQEVLPEPEVEDTRTDRQKSVDQKIEETKEQWEQKHRNWAEQQVSKDNIADEEARLAELRQEELSF